MCDWMRQCAELASPLYELMKQRTLSSKVVQTDDTPVPALPGFTGRLRLYSATGFVTPADMLAGRQRAIHAARDRKLEEARRQRQLRRRQAA